MEALCDESLFRQDRDQGKARVAATNYLKRLTTRVGTSWVTTQCCWAIARRLRIGLGLRFGFVLG